MNKLALLVAVLALAGSVAALVLRPGAAPSSAEATTVAAGGSLSDRDIRLLREEYDAASRGRDANLLRELDLRLKRLEELRSAWTTAFQQAHKAMEGAARENAGKLESVDDQIVALSTGIKQQEAALEELRVQVRELAQRPVAVAPPAAGPAPAPGPGPRPTPAEPPKPALSSEPAEDPAEVKKKVDAALVTLDSNDPEKLFPAILVVKKYKALEAVPKLVKLLAPTPHPDVFTRQAVTEALGDLRACDAVPVLAEALTDKAVMVSQQANKSLRLITEFDTGLSPQAKVLERRKARQDLMEWWGRHEDEVRARWNQPKK